MTHQEALTKLKAAFPGHRACVGCTCWVQEDGPIDLPSIYCYVYDYPTKERDQNIITGGKSLSEAVEAAIAKKDETFIAEVNEMLA